MLSLVAHRSRWADSLIYACMQIYANAEPQIGEQFMRISVFGLRKFHLVMVNVRFCCITTSPKEAQVFKTLLGQPWTVCRRKTMSDELNIGIRLSEQKRLESSVEGRQRRCRRNFRWQAVPHPRASNQNCSAANSGTVNRRLDEAVAAGSAKSSATWKVGNVSERANM